MEVSSFFRLGSVLAIAFLAGPWHCRADSVDLSGSDSTLAFGADNPMKDPTAWKSVVDQDSGKLYYYNRVTHITTWEEPEILKNIPRPEGAQAETLTEHPEQEREEQRQRKQPPKPTTPWRTRKDPKSKANYYYNTITKQVSWARPADYGGAPAPTVTVSTLRSQSGYCDQSGAANLTASYRTTTYDSGSFVIFDAESGKMRATGSLTGSGVSGAASVFHGGCLEGPNWARSPCTCHTVASEGTAYVSCEINADGSSRYVCTGVYSYVFSYT